MDEKIKIYYDSKTNYICDRYPSDISHTDTSPFIEVDQTTYNETLCVPYGKIWAVKDNTLSIVDDENIISSNKYKNEEIMNKINDNKMYLESTDYIVTKLAEAQIEDSENFIALKAKYADILAKRKEARDEINSLSESLAQLETLTNS